jgi:glutathione synthase
MLDLLYVMDPMHTVSVDKDSTFVIQLEAQTRGHHNYHCLPTDLYVERGQVCARVRRLEVVRVQGSHATFGEPEARPLASFAAVLMRKDPPFDMAYVFSTYLLEHAVRDTLVLNRPDSLRDCNEKLFTLQFPQFTPTTIVATEKRQVRDFIAEMGGLGVIKPLDGAGGEGVFLLKSEDPNFNAIVEGVTRHGTRYAMVQRYVPEIRTRGDKRIIMLEGEPIGAIARIPPSGDLRGNIHVGGTVEKTGLTERDREIAAGVGAELRNRGLWFVGLDVIGDYLTEINVTSPTGVQEANALNGVRLEQTIVSSLESKVRDFQAARR